MENILNISWYKITASLLLVFSVLFGELVVLLMEF